jgi:hypothetical protein
VVVPVWEESTRPVLGLAGRLAESDGGIVLATTFASVEAPDAELASQRALLERAEEWLAKRGLEPRTVLSVASSIERGLLETVRSQSATLLVVDWRYPDRAQLGGENSAFQLMTRSPVPVLMAHGALESIGRLVLVAGAGNLVDPGRLDLEVAAEVTKRIARGGSVVCVATSRAHVAPLFPPKLDVEQVESKDPLGWFKENGRDGDLLVLAGLDAASQALDRLPGLAEKRFLVAIGAHGRAAVHTEEGLAQVALGRSVTEGA